ncbi:MAG: WxL domain-containing protein [Enterococcus casseliflavus]
MSLRRPMLVLGTTLLLMQVLFMSIVTVYAEYNNNISDSTEATSDIDDYSQYEGQVIEKYTENTGELIPSTVNNIFKPKENDIASRDSTSVRFEDFYKASVLDSNNLFLKPEIIPMNAIPLFLDNSTDTPLLNGREMVLGIRYSVTRNTEQILEIRNIGHDYRGNSVDVSMNFELVSTTNRGGGSITWTNTGIQIEPSNQSNTRASDIKYTLKTSYSDKNLGEVSDPILIQASGLGRTETINQENLYAVASQTTYFPVVINNLSREYTISAGTNATYNYYITPTTEFNIVRQISSGQILQSSYTIFTQFSSLPQFNVSPPEIFGFEETENFISRYSLVQEVPSFLTYSQSDMAIDVYHPFASDSVIVSAKGELGEEYKDYLNVTSLLDEKVSINIPHSLSGKRLDIEIEVPLDKNNELYAYLKNEELLFDISAENNLISETVTSTTKTWVRPWGEPLSKEISIGTSTNELDPTEFVRNLDNKLQHDEPFVVGFNEERIFNVLGETSIGVVIESEISGIQNTIDVPITVVENKGTIFVHHTDEEGKTVADSDKLIGKIGEAYKTLPKEIENYRVTKVPENATGIYSEEDIDVTYIYEIAPVFPVDPLEPEIEVDPENKPELPEDQGLFSIDFVSSFNFGTQTISVHDQVYYAQPQRLLNEDGTVNESEERPNYIQVSDRRPEEKRHGWQLAVTQNSQFTDNQDNQLRGARLLLNNQQLASVLENGEPILQNQDGVVLIPEEKTTLVRARDGQGIGTWVYRFGDRESAGESVALEVPPTADPRATTYQTTLTWELSSVPDN